MRPVCSKKSYGYNFLCQNSSSALPKSYSELQQVTIGNLENDSNSVVDSYYRWQITFEWS